jgi:hypothetical protein
VSRVRWKENAVLSIKIRDDLYCLAQMLLPPYLVFFDCFGANDEWGDVVLEATPVLFYRGVTRQLLRSSDIAVHREIAPATAPAIDPPTRWLQVGPGSQALTIWQGSADEMTVMTLGEEGVRVVVKDIGTPGAPGAMAVGPYLRGPHHDEIDAYELDTLGVYPETIERLFLCHHFGRNVDPDKDLICGRDLPREFRSYYEAISV